MTELLKEFLAELGRLSITVSNLEMAREQWSSNLGPVMSEEELAKVPIDKDEPVLIVRASKKEDIELFESPKDHGIQIIDQDTGRATGQLTVWDVSEDEFYFFKAFRDGMNNLRQRMPEFFLRMCLIHSHTLFESYLTDILNCLFLARPEMLGRSRQVGYGDILDTYPSMDSLLEKMVQRQVREIFYKSRRDLLACLREKYGFSELTTKYDAAIVESSLVRNCLLHNKGVIDQKLERELQGPYKSGNLLLVDNGMLSKFTYAFKKFSFQVDNLAKTLMLADG